MNHPVVIITSDPEGVQHAVQHLQVEGYEVKVLDSLSANLIDFFGALSSTEPDQFQVVDDTIATEDEPQIGDDGQPTTPDDASEANGQVFHGTIDDEPIEVHEVEGGDLVLHPVALSGDGAKKKFKLSEEVEISVNFGMLFESEQADTPNTVKVHFVVEELGIDTDVDVALSEMVMTPPAIMMGKDWFAQHTTGDTTPKVTQTKDSATDAAPTVTDPNID